LPFGPRWRFPAVWHVHLTRHASRQDAGGTQVRPENRVTEKREERGSRTDERQSDPVQPDDVQLMSSKLVTCKNGNDGLGRRFRSCGRQAMWPATQGLTTVRN
jgi:hypothetical protein